jgi:hypothetical protein
MPHSDTSRLGRFKLLTTKPTLLKLSLNSFNVFFTLAPRPAGSSTSLLKRCQKQLSSKYSFNISLWRSARKSRLERIRYEHIKEIFGVKEKTDIIDIIEMKRLQWYGHVKRMQRERLPILIMELIPGEGRKRGRPRKTWMEGVRAARNTRRLEADHWLNRNEWCLGSGRRRQLSQDRIDR